MTLPLDISRLSLQERLDLIERLWDSLDGEDVPLTSAQETELDRRVATLADDAAEARPAEDVLAELKARYR